MTKNSRNVILNAVRNPAYSLGESYLKGHKSFNTRNIAQAVGILPRPKSSFRMTKNSRNVILNAVKNPAYSLGESCLKDHKSFNTRTIAQAVGILPRPKAPSE
ncbi:hypothetical protein [Gillisia limnaea]|uniref:Uncharacterized protein n=1 Tax=Gillisia limnaea (strain DSM 15749 / LMG 21470 / R-8282) TaxID=865937 RepID=H2C042_GILLR|nr:hypothetical protein [Gillisia limnaea]EHQ02409.1 hypothetical protein Gilli_1766 [Gillisia limnaea DSM 15749]